MPKRVESKPLENGREVRGCAGAYLPILSHLLEARTEAFEIGGKESPLCQVIDAAYEVAKDVRMEAVMSAPE